MADEVTNVVFAGLGGQGVLKASDVLASVVFDAGLDLKKSEVHGMSQRGGSVTSDVRYGREVLSPMVPDGEADYLVVLDAGQVDNNRHYLRSDGVLLTPDMIDVASLANSKSLNVALLGLLSNHLPFDAEQWYQAIEANLPAKLHAVNREAFALGRSSDS